MDDLDRAIVSLLAVEGRLSNVDLAARVGLTPAPCLRRVRRLEAEGIIKGYRAVVDPVAAGRAFEVLVDVDLLVQDAATVEQFEESVVGAGQVVEVRRLFGRPDYHLRVAVPDLAAYEEFVTRTLSVLPGVAHVHSRFPMKTLKG